MRASFVALILALAPLTPCVAKMAPQPAQLAPPAPGRSQATVPSTTTGPAQTNTLAVAASPISAFTLNFNPFDHRSATWRDGLTQFLYEPLLEYDGAQDNQYYPWLASAWTFSSSGQNVTFSLRPGIRWDDGSPLTAADVAYTFNLIKAAPSLVPDLPVVGAVANDAHTFTLTLSGPAYSYLDQIAQVPVVKVGYGRGVTDVAGYVDRSPDGTGPYQLAAGGFSPREITLGARPRYWQGRPPIARLSFPALANEEAISDALVAGHLDWAQDFMPDVQVFIKQDPSQDHFWFVPDSCTVMELNFSAGAFGRLAVRRAMSNALDRSALSSAAAGGYDPPAADASGLVLPRDAQYLPVAGRATLSAHSRLTATALLMRSAGFQRSGSGPWHDKSGRSVKIDILAARGTPLATLAADAAGQLRRAGFAASWSALSAAKLARDLADGHFDAAIMAGNKSPSPYFEYKAWFKTFSPAREAARSGLKPAQSPLAQAQGFLSGFKSSPPGSTAATAALRHLANLAAAQLPVIPLVYDVAWGEYSTRDATGWPDDADAYEPATPTAPFAEYTVLQLSPGL